MSSDALEIAQDVEVEPRGFDRFGALFAQALEVSFGGIRFHFPDFGLARDELAGNLSGGQKKLLELGRTMMTEPRVVLLDEPGAGVNRTLLGKLTESIERLNKEEGYTFVVIEHDMDLIARLCDPVIVMAQGRVIARGPMSEIRANQEVLDAYLGGAGVSDGTGEEAR